MACPFLSLIAYIHQSFYIDPGTPYTVIVVAFTSAGRGEENNPYTFFSHEEPPQRAPENVTNNVTNTSIIITWEPLDLFEARGFPVYTVTLTPTFERRKREFNVDGVITVTTNGSHVVIVDFDPNVEYSLTVAVGTSSGQAMSPKSM